MMVCKRYLLSNMDIFSIHVFEGVLFPSSNIGLFVENTTSHIQSHTEGLFFLDEFTSSTNGKLLVWGPVLWDSNRGTAFITIRTIGPQATNPKPLVDVFLPKKTQQAENNNFHQINSSGLNFAS